MSSVTLELPDSLKRSIEALAAAEGYSLEQFLAAAAGEKLSVVLTMDYLRREAAAGRRDAFESFLHAVPDVEPGPIDGTGLQPPCPGR
ncbi:toxin-antitoxin system HicB family antitoxin [bacterium]|nr:toxin-antitoxin system HicB family antitoxin [bacterium]